MYQYRQVLVRLRAGDSVREVARTGLMGRDKLGELCSVARQHGWLDAASVAQNSVGANTRSLCSRCPTPVFEKQSMAERGSYRSNTNDRNVQHQENKNAVSAVVAATVATFDAVFAAWCCVGVRQTTV